MGWLAGQLIELLPGRTVVAACAFGDGGIGLVFADGAMLYLAGDADVEPEARRTASTVAPGIKPDV